VINIDFRNLSAYKKAYKDFKMNSCKIAMDKEKAQEVLDEILISWRWKEEAPIQGYFINCSESTDECVLKLILPSGKDWMSCIKPVVENHGLAMKQLEGCLIICAP
jgi:hypothetical protein